MGLGIEALNFDSTTFKVYFICVALLLLKMFFMVPLIARQRFLKKVVLSPEDTIFHRGLKVKYNDPDVERVRRAHLNDLENILLFICIGSLYTMLAPNTLIATLLFVTYTIARFAHTYVYAVVVTKQPSRLICYAIGYLITCYMAGSVVLSLKDAM